jgi:hypothetical protein
MSVIMMLRVKGDPVGAENWAAENTDRLMAISNAGKAAGAIHHVFTAGEGEICVIDEWPDEASFQKFFASQADIPVMMQAAGVKGQPEITFLRKMDMPDEF